MGDCASSTRGRTEIVVLHGGAIPQVSFDHRGLNVNSRIWTMALALAASALSACSVGTNAIVDTLRNVVPIETAADAARLNPQFRYLRVTAGGRVALLVLGYTEPHRDGPIEIWYSAQREVLRIQNGRLVGATGLTTEWRSVSLPAMPSWSALAQASTRLSWTRIRDVMPGYRFGVRDELSLGRIAAPIQSLLRVLDPEHLAWFDERHEGEPRADVWLPAAHYAVQLSAGRETVIYGEQCIALDLCFAWQRWPVESKAAGN